MNEPSNFYNGHEDGCPRDQKVERPPYVPGLDPLCTRTLCMSDQHYSSSHYNVHSVYSQLEARATYRALVEIRHKRPFIISRSTSPGQGAWSGHWSGDIESTWTDMRLSIPNVLSFGMYGIPLSGADICGFAGNTTVELCARWQVLGAFYPFARNHNGLFVKDQDPYSMGPEVVQATRIALTVRYAILPYLYTLFYRSHVCGETVARALFFEFPEDPITYDIDEQFMWGSALLISPALYKGQTKVKAYVPRGTWYDVYDGRRYEQPSGGYHYFPAPIDKANILVRGGHIVPMQEPATTTAVSRKNPIWVFVAPRDQKAQGVTYWDDGESLDAVQKQTYSMYNFTLVKDLLKVKHVKRGSNITLTFGGAIVTGVDARPHAVAIVGGRPLSFSYSQTEQTLRIYDVGEPMDEDFGITWFTES